MELDQTWNYMRYLGTTCTLQQWPAHSLSPRDALSTITDRQAPFLQQLSSKPSIKTALPSNPTMQLVLNQHITVHIVEVMGTTLCRSWESQATQLLHECRHQVEWEEPSTCTGWQQKLLRKGSLTWKRGRCLKGWGSEVYTWHGEQTPSAAGKAWGRMRGSPYNKKRSVFPTIKKIRGVFPTRVVLKNNNNATRGVFPTKVVLTTKKSCNKRGIPYIRYLLLKILGSFPEWSKIVTIYFEQALPLQSRLHFLLTYAH